MKVHFIGAGGIGVSALAKYYLASGAKVSGSDLSASEITRDLEKKGAVFFLGQKAANVPPDADKIIYSPAIKPSNPEFKEAKNKKIKIQSYPEALGELTKKYFTVAVSGAHGKSTTTAMIGLLLAKAGLNPTVVVGTKLKEFGDSNFRMGGAPSRKFRRFFNEKILVIEACEHEESFLNYFPKIIVITNVEREHLDYYKNLRNVLKAFKKFAGRLPEDGAAVINADDANIPKLKITAEELKKYSLKQEEAAKIRKILKIPGEHNVSNSLAALAVARLFNVPDEISYKALAEYRGSWRRFETKERRLPNKKKITIIDDYGHHPTEISATLKAAREKFPREKIWCVFQPHQYQRTYFLFKDFVKVFSEASVDKLIIIDVYDVAGRENEKIKNKVNSLKLVEAINKKKIKNPAVYLPSAETAKNYLINSLKGGEIVVIMGAGDIYYKFKNL